MSELDLTPKSWLARFGSRWARSPTGVRAVGPKLIKSRPVLYPISEVENWEREMLASSKAPAYARKNEG